jgi:hypothetical protein
MVTGYARRMTLRWWGVVTAAVAIAASVGCGGKVVYEGVGGGDATAGNAADVGNGAGNGNGNGASGTASGGTVDLEAVCKQFCDKYQTCAPETDCKIGCMSSAVLACKKEYAADVTCITQHLQSCAGFTEPCKVQQQAYEDCVAQH